MVHRTTEHGDARPGENRIEALSDGIFAIVMTLLVLELHAPELARNAANTQLAPALLALGPRLATSAVSFLGLGVLWVGHHNMYHAICRSNRMLLWLNLLFFMLVSLLPFSASLLNAFPETQVEPLFFRANVALIGGALFLQWSYTGRRPELLGAHLTREYRELVRSRFLWLPLALTLAICFWSVPITLAACALLMPFYVIPGGPAPARIGRTGPTTAALSGESP